MGFVQEIPRDQLILYPERLDDVVGVDPVRMMLAYCLSVPCQELGFSHAVAANTGRPGYPAASLLALYLWGFSNGVTSSRKLEEATRKRTDVMWLMGRMQPDYKTISEFRRRNVEAIKKLGVDFTGWLAEQELVDGDLVAIDGSKFRASNAKDRNFTEKTLADKRARTEARLREYLERLEQADAADEAEGEPSALTAERLQAAIESLQKRKAVFDAMAEAMKKDGSKQVSLTDPDSRSMKSNDGTRVCYNAQIAVDGKHNLIVASAVTNEGNDEQQLFAMASAAKQALNQESLTVVADAGYVNTAEIAKCDEANITAYLPALDPAEREGTFAKKQFRYDPATDSYTCPAGKTLVHSTQGRDRGRIIHYYRTRECMRCPLRPQCTSAKDGRRLARREGEGARDAGVERSRSRPDLIKKRKSMAEHPFGTIKRQINHGYFRLRGLAKVGAEFALAVLAYNFKRILTIQSAAAVV